MRIWFFDRERFEEKYNRLRNERAHELPDDRHLNLFAA